MEKIKKRKSFVTVKGIINFIVLNFIVCLVAHILGIIVGKGII